MTSALTPAAGAPVELTKADFQSDVETRWCPGCGDYAILAAMQGFLPELGIPPEQIVFVSGIGCAGRFSYYMNTYGMHGIHGRAPALATGLAAARPDLSVWVVSGDGDALSIGGNHLIHALRRDVPVKILLFNNRIYGLTKGQASPTSELGKVTKSTPFGLSDAPFDPIALAIGAGATFVARTLDTDKQTRPDQVIELEHGEPIRFGAEREQGIVRGRDGDLTVAAVADVGEDALLRHDAQRADPSLAFALSRLGGLEGGATPIGIFRQVAHENTFSSLSRELAQARSSFGTEELSGLLHQADTWSVGV